MIKILHKSILKLFVCHKNYLYTIYRKYEHNQENIVWQNKIDPRLLNNQKHCVAHTAHGEIPDPSMQLNIYCSTYIKNNLYTIECKLQLHNPMT